MSRHVYEFGPFQLDPIRRQLQRNGSPVALTPKAFDTLLALVEHHGTVVEKDALMHAVWGDTIVEEVGLARNISALRKALGERRDEHRYIVTEPGRGYRFVDDVRTVDLADSVTPPAPRIETTDAPHVMSARQAAIRTPARRVHAVLFAAVGLALVVGIVSLTRPGSTGAALSEQDVIVVADFLNATGDPAFDRVLGLGLTAQLEQSPFLRIFPDGRVRDTLRMMGRPPEEPVGLALAREVGLRHGIKAAVGGEIRALGDHYVLTLEAANAQTGERVARALTEVARKEDVLRGLSEAVKVLRPELT